MNWTHGFGAPASPGRCILFPAPGIVIFYLYHKAPPTAAEIAEQDIQENQSGRIVPSLSHRNKWISSVWVGYVCTKMRKDCKRLKKLECSGVNESWEK